jgi:hypothetical protein
VRGLISVKAAEREHVRMVLNLFSGVKMPFPENLGNNLAHFERIEVKTNRASVACLRPHWTDKLVFLSRGDSQSLYDESIQVALKYLGK